MFNWFNMKKKSLPQQVLENTKDIEKLYDQELSDITQLNYKQDAEDSLTYADGKATFKGKMSIIRNENTQNLIVDSEVEVNISSGDDDIIIDAGEDNVSLKIRLDNATRNKINKALQIPINAPLEDEFVVIGTNNAQKNITKSEVYKGIKIFDIIYDEKKNNIINDIAYTGGILGGTDINFDFSEYDAVILQGSMEEYFGTQFNVVIDLNIKTEYGYYIGQAFCRNQFYITTPDYNKRDNYALFKINPEKNVLSSTYLNIDVQTLTNKNNNNSYRISKIWGVKYEYIN